MTTTRESLTDRERLLAELCVHEAAHAVAGVVLGGVLRAASVTGGLHAGELRGRTTFESLPSGAEAQTAYAGPWAAVRWLHGRRPTQAELYAAIAQGHDSDGAVLSAAGGTAAGAPVVPLIERLWPQVRHLAGNIAGQTTVRHSDVLGALGLSADPATSSLALAHIRAGAAPGSFRVRRPVAV